jgi:hypothetical protein
MNKPQASNIISHLEHCKKIYTNAIENNAIEKCCYIVEVGALTAGSDEKGKVIAQNVLYPTQFSNVAVETILSMNWKDGNGRKITPIVFNRNDWYTQKIKIVQQTLSLLN